MGILLVLQAAPPDTIVMVASRDVFDLLFAAAAFSIAVTFAVLLSLILGAVRQLARASAMLDSARSQLASDPAIESLRKTASHIEGIAGAVHEEVERLQGSVAGLSQRIDQAAQRMEERIDDANALLEVVQEEAEGVVLRGIARVRGVRAGFGALRRRAPRTGDGGASDPPDPPSPGGREPSPDPSEFSATLDPDLEGTELDR